MSKKSLAVGKGQIFHINKIPRDQRIKFLPERRLLGLVLVMLHSFLSGRFQFLSLVIVLFPAHSKSCEFRESVSRF